ncbi:MAG: energy transducer TonB [Bacteroidaceae bacterium]|nr:energy transducer TonB [Bacteroidaceae bacterium]MBR0272645.1 energy transducer TonB [Bacteroidaceae bacterium]
MLYLIKLNLILALLCLLFQVLMHRDTFFGVRRLMLWGIYATAFLLPLCDVQALLTADTAATDMAEAYASYVLPTIEVTAMRVSTLGIEQSEPGCGMWFVGLMALWAILYLIPVVWMTLKLLWQVAYIIYLRCTCKAVRMTNDESRFARNDEFTPPLSNRSNPHSSFVTRHSSFFLFPRPCSPFSFGPWIFIHPDGMDEQTLREVLIHEQAHVRGWHTLDILFSQLVCILFWWNPAAWLMRREVRMNLEFIADKAVADYLMEMKNEESPYFSSFNSHSSLIKAYQYRLLGFATQTNVATIANNFNVLPLKRRIIMMNLKRTRRTGMVKYAVFVPIAAALLFLSNIDALARSIKAKVKPLAHIEQAITAPQTIASVMEDVQPAAEEPIVEQMERIVEETSAVQDSVVSEVTSPKALNLVHLHDKALWVVDNKVSTKEDAAKLNADDIESIAVLEDNAATSVWGSRGANGVVVIKTKNAPMDGGDPIYDIVEQLPKYPGGEAELYGWMAMNLKYPVAAMEWGVQGRVIVTFVVEKDGTLTDISAAKLVDPKSGQEMCEIVVTAKTNGQTPEEVEAAKHLTEGIKALKAEGERVVKALPKRWEPGKQGGKPVRVRFNLPITFRLQ